MTNEDDTTAAPEKAAVTKANPIDPMGTQATLAKVLDAKREGICKLIGKEREQIFRSRFLAVAAKTPDLLQCTTESYIAAMQHCAIVGLLPGPGDHIYLIPRGNKHLPPLDGKRRKEVTVMHGYKGLMELARRHPDVAMVEAKLVYADDDFHINESTKVVHHIFDENTDHSPNKIVGAYSRVYLRDLMDHPLIHWMPRSEIEKRRNRSQQAKGNFWRDDYAAMSRKTAIRSHLNGGEVPLTNEMELAIQEDFASEEIEQADVVKVTDAGGVGGVAALSAAVGVEIKAPESKQQPEPVRRRPPEDDAEDAARLADRQTDLFPSGRGAP